MADVVLLIAHLKFCVGSFPERKNSKTFDRTKVWRKKAGVNPVFCLCFCLLLLLLKSKKTRTSGRGGGAEMKKEQKKEQKKNKKERTKTERDGSK